MTTTPRGPIMDRRYWPTDKTYNLPRPADGCPACDSPLEPRDGGRYRCTGTGLDLTPEQIDTIARGNEITAAIRQRRADQTVADVLAEQTEAGAA